jgi:hypothetical protein
MSSRVPTPTLPLPHLLWETVMPVGTRCSGIQCRG